MSDLKKQAAELGIKVDGRWSDERIQEEIDAKLAEPAPDPDGNLPDPDLQQQRDPLDHDGDGKKGGAAPALIPVRVKRDFWDAGGARHRKGTVVEVSVEAALDGIETGALSRVK